MLNELQTETTALIQIALETIYKIGSAISDSIIFISNNLTAQIVIGFIAILITLRNYLRKSGISIRGGFCTSYGYQSSQPHISEIILINQKDRPVSIYKIYLKIGHNYYLELHDSEDSPITLKPYESLTKRIPLPYAYGVSTKLVDINDLIKSEKTKKKIVLATDYGKYEVKKRIKMWNPIIEGLHKNHFIGTITPVYAYHGNREIGDSIIYCLETSLNQEKKSYYIYKNNDSKTFYNINFSSTEKSSKESLMNSIEEHKRKGTIPKELEITIKEPKELNLHLQGYDSSPAIPLRPYSMFLFYVVGKIYTLWRRAEIKFQSPIRKIKKTVEKLSKKQSKER